MSHVFFPSSQENFLNQIYNTVSQKTPTRRCVIFLFVSIGSSVDQNKKSPSFLPIDQKILFLLRIFTWVNFFLNCTSYRHFLGHTLNNKAQTLPSSFICLWNCIFLIIENTKRINDKHKSFLQPPRVDILHCYMAAVKTDHLDLVSMSGLHA